MLRVPEGGLALLTGAAHSPGPLAWSECADKKAAARTHTTSLCRLPTATPSTEDPAGDSGCFQARLVLPSLGFRKNTEENLATAGWRDSFLTPRPLHTLSVIPWGPPGRRADGLTTLGSVELTTVVLPGRMPLLFCGCGWSKCGPPVESRGSGRRGGINSIWVAGLGVLWRSIPPVPLHSHGVRVHQQLGPTLPPSLSVGTQLCGIPMRPAPRCCHWAGAGSPEDARPASPEGFIQLLLVDT